jgi:amidohydrolase
MEETTIRDLTAFRKELHTYPEVSQQESETQRRIIEFLARYGIEGKKIGGTGVFVVFDSGKEGKTVMLRSDHDALAIHEINEFEHKSRNEGVSHKCGHDGHTTIMCGVAQYLKEHPVAKGKVVLIFQPAEENGAGAKAILADKQFDFEPDMVFALHNLPGYPLHQIVIKEGNFTAAAKTIIVKLSGKTAHAAEPESGINPASAISELIRMFEGVCQPDLNRDDFALATPVFIHMGELSYGVSAGYGEVHYTLRTWNRETMNPLTETILEKVEEITDKYHLIKEIGWAEEFSSNRNDAQAVQLISKASDQLGFDKEVRKRPFKWGEDFGLFTQKFPGAMFGLGSGEDCPALHNPDYDFPDEITETGIKMFTTIVEKATDE